MIDESEWRTHLAGWTVPVRLQLLNLKSKKLIIKDRKVKGTV